MSTAKHTPGPWAVGRSHLRGSDSPNGASIIATDGSLIARMPAVADRNLDEKGANARLIAASPELLEALNSVPSDADYGSAEDFCAAVNDWWLRTASPAIAKATGELA